MRPCRDKEERGAQMEAVRQKRWCDWEGEARARGQAHLESLLHGRDADAKERQRIHGELEPNVREFFLQRQTSESVEGRGGGGGAGGQGGRGRGAKRRTRESMGVFPDSSMFASTGLPYFAASEQTCLISSSLCSASLRGEGEGTKSAERKGRRAMRGKVDLTRRPCRPRFCRKPRYATASPPWRLLVLSRFSR